MDWDRVIERNREALKRILAALVAMAGLGDWRISPLEGEMSAKPTEGGSVPRGEIGLTLPRRLHRAVLRLLRPAEAAARRLVIVAARGLAVTLPRWRAPKPNPKAGHAALRRLGIAVVLSSAEIARAAAERRRAEKRAARAPRPLLLPLADPRPRLGPRRARTVPPHAAPRVLSFYGAAPHRLPKPPSPGDPLDATRLVARLRALAAALADLPGEAMRFARWQARRARAAAQGRRGLCLSPLKPGRPPGSCRRSKHDVHEVLRDMQHFARRALETPDTS